MSAPPVLVDSSWYIQRTREGKDPIFILGLYSEMRDIAVCGIVMGEVGRGVRDLKNLKKFRIGWANMRYVESTEAIWRNTMMLAWEMDRRGDVLPIQDLHIAACAQHIGAVILTEDQHFQRIPGVDATNRIY